jgi:hypothetical protein
MTLAPLSISIGDPTLTQKQQRQRYTSHKIRLTEKIKNSFKPEVGHSCNLSGGKMRDCESERSGALRVV